MIQKQGKPDNLSQVFEEDFRPGRKQLHTYKSGQLWQNIPCKSTSHEQGCYFVYLISDFKAAFGDSQTSTHPPSVKGNSS